MSKLVDDPSKIGPGSYNVKNTFINQAKAHEENDEKKYGPAWSNAQAIKQSAADAIKFIEDLKIDLVFKVENLDKGEKVYTFVITPDIVVVTEIT
mgnify:CR=1 FL=1